MSDTKKKVLDEDTVVDNHPAGVAVRFARVSGRRDLFGQTMPVDNYIELTITNAVIKHDLGRDWMSATSLPLIQVALSYVQFAELLTTLNVGVGIAGTMTAFNRESIEPYTREETPMERVEKYGDESIQEMIAKNEAALNKLDELIKNSKLTKKDKEEIHSQIYVLNHLRSNYKFYLDSYRKIVGKVKAEAKSEIDAFVTHTIHQFGQEVLEQKLNLTQIEQKKKT